MGIARSRRDTLRFIRNSELAALRGSGLEASAGVFTSRASANHATTALRDCGQKVGGGRGCTCDDFPEIGVRIRTMHAVVSAGTAKLDLEASRDIVDCAGLLG